MNVKRIHESVAEAPVKSGNRWRVIVARPGVGSSGKYSEEVFKRDAAKIVPPNAQAYVNHDVKRDPREMIGTYPEGAFWSEEDKAVVAELDVFSHWKTFVEEVGPHCGISLYAMGEQDDEGNVTAFIEDVYNGADLVSRPGLTGSGLAAKLYEAAFNASDKLPTELSEGEGKDTQVMDEKIEALTATVTALATSVEALVSANKTKAEEAAQVEADEKAVAEAVERFASQSKAIDEADLLPEQADALRAEAKTGADITDKITEAKALKEAFEKRFTESAETFTAGRLMGSSVTTSYGAFK